jgi:bifunctional DNA-binding transcriptional regulator/antitoxin component of YhaV-PrlF toxin-antitoxin module
MDPSGEARLGWGMDAETKEYLDDIFAGIVVPMTAWFDRLATPDGAARFTTDVGVARLSPDGHVDIPEPIRDALKLEPGTQFVVVAEGDAVVLHAIRPTGRQEADPEEMRPLLAQAEHLAAEVERRLQNVQAAIRKKRQED